jgi:hypothetical protein
MQALDRLGASEDKAIGDLTDGSRVAETMRRNYGQGLRQLLRTAHWSFARKRAKLTLLGDASGLANPPVSPHVESPWRYAWAWPIDAVQGRWLPLNPVNNIPENSSGVPLTTGPSAPLQYMSLPGRFLVSSSDQYPVVTGSTPWDQMPDLQRTEGVGPTTRKVILTDSGDAHFVYTRLVTTIEEWDGLFREAMVTMMAMVLAPVAIDDRRAATAERDRLIPILKNAIDNARLASGNEAGFPQTIDQDASYIRARNRGAGWGGGWLGGGGFGFGGGLGGNGYYGLGWESLNWNGSVY